METIEELKGKVVNKLIKIGDEEVHFYTECGKHYKMYHYQDCCEHVYLEDITGDLKDLIGSVIIMSEEVKQMSDDDNHEIGTWTFYKFATQKGYITFRWFGEQSYYSEEADFEEIY